MLNLLLSTDLYLEVGESMGFDFSTRKDRLDVGVQERLSKASYGRDARNSCHMDTLLLSIPSYWVYPSNPNMRSHQCHVLIISTPDDVSIHRCFI